jgi:hypothetical protein
MLAFCTLKLSNKIMREPDDIFYVALGQTWFILLFHFTTFFNNTSCYFSYGLCIQF